MDQATADAARRAKQREYGRKYDETHRAERATASRREWAENPEKVRERKRRYGARHPDRIKNYRKAYYAANREQVLQYSRAYRVARKHGLTPEAWNALWTAQDGRCYLCRRELSADDLVIDHDHRCCPPRSSCTACRRGFACESCNLAIGKADDDPDRLLLIAANLRKAKQAVDERMHSKPTQGTLFEA